MHLKRPSMYGNTLIMLMRRSILISDHIHRIDETNVDKPLVNIVVDQAVYAKAVEVRASYFGDLERIVWKLKRDIISFLCNLDVRSSQDVVRPSQDVVRPSQDVVRPSQAVVRPS